MSTYRSQVLSMKEMLDYIELTRGNHVKLHDTELNVQTSVSDNLVSVLALVNLVSVLISSSVK